MSPFEDELDANASRVSNNTENDLDNGESPGGEILDPKNSDFHPSPKHKHAPITSELAHNEKPALMRHYYPETMSPSTLLKAPQ